MLDWSKEKVLKFIELYSAEKVIWDPANKNHKVKRKVCDAWRRISAELEHTPIDELKAKKKSLMATFRPLLKKKKASMKSGADDDDLFQPIWFAFDVMENFLGSVYDTEDTLNSEDEVQYTDEAPSLESGPGPSQNKSTKNIKTEEQDNNVPKKRNKRMDPQSSDADQAQKNTNDSFTTPQALQSHNKTDKDDDDCDLYGKLLAKKLRKYPDIMRQRIMYKIDGLLLDNPYPDAF